MDLGDKSPQRPRGIIAPQVHYLFSRGIIAKMEELTLSELLSALIAGSLTVPTVQWVLHQVPSEITKNQKRMVAVGLSFLLGIGAFFASIYLGYIQSPIGIEAWFNSLWPVCFAAFGASQIVLSGIRTDTVQAFIKKHRK
jgi:hypothetical protein